MTKKMICINFRPYKFIITIIILFSTISVVQADTWYGTAPFCNGQCPAGQTQIATSPTGNGARCWTGQKVLCRDPQPLCTPRQTNATCWGVVLMCNDGFNELGGNWVSCSTYACGLCFGFGSW